MSKSDPIAIYVSVPRVKQPNTFTFEEWCDAYGDYITDMYYMLKKHNEELKINIYDKLDYQTFVEFVYYYSDKRIPQWYKEEKRRRYHLTDLET